MGERYFFFGAGDFVIPKYSKPVPPHAYNFDSVQKKLLIKASLSCPRHQNLKISSVVIFKCAKGAQAIIIMSFNIPQFVQWNFELSTYS